MIASYKDRVVDLNKSVYIYKNLSNNMFSIKQGKHVVGHSIALTLKNCEFIVSEKGRQRVIKNRRKNVHAFIKGEIMALPCLSTFLKQVKYNPYYNSTFMSKSGPIKQAKYVTLTPFGVFTK